MWRPVAPVTKPTRRAEPLWRGADRNDIVAWVLRSLETPHALDDCVSLETRAALGAVRAAFISAGIERVERQLRWDRWLQLSLELREERGYRAILSGRLATDVQRWLDCGAISSFSFLNKSPGVKLRVCGRNLDATVARALDRRARAYLKSGYARSYHFGPYDGEVHQFGGEEGLSLFHQFSTIDSLTVLRLGYRTTCDVQTSLAISLAMLSSLFRTVTRDRSELWDIWCNMALAGRGGLGGVESTPGIETTFRDNRQMLEAIAMSPDVVLQDLPERSRRVCLVYCEHIQALGTRLVAAEQGGRLLFGLRRILPFYAIFHWNRWRFPLAVQCMMTELMTRTLSPK
jgi:thiopeptide-type bacteriocin biosynthesis protein